MESEFRTYSVVPANQTFRIVPGTSCWRRVVIVTLGVVFVSADPTTGVAGGLPGGGNAFVVGATFFPAVFILSPSQALYAFVGDGGAPTTVSVAISETPAGCLTD